VTCCLSHPVEELQTAENLLISPEPQPPAAYPEAVRAHHPSHDGELVRVAYANDSLEGQMISGLLESEGIDCLQLLGPTGNQIAYPAALGARDSGPRRVLVRADDAERAINLLERQRGEVDEYEAREAPEASC
jgi:hypothetical protein